MNVIIIEDEKPSARRLQRMLASLQIEAHTMLHSVEESMAWFSENQHPDLIFLDIQLSDGLSFEIFETLEINSAVIFTTAYDAYALQAFKLNSIDYLLKPVQNEDLEKAIQKFKGYAKKHEGDTHALNMDSILKQLQQKLQPKEYRKRFLVKNGQKLVSIEVADIRYFFSDGRLNFFKTADNKKFVVDYTIDELEEMLDPDVYFRISRSFYVSINSIEKIDDYFGNRLILQLKPAVDKEALVSREKVTDFKRWMGK